MELRRRILAGALAIAIVLPASRTLARHAPGAVGGAPRPIRMEGYWDRDSQAPGVLEGIPITPSKGGQPRTFGITALQAFQPEEEGAQVLRHSSLQPSLRVLGRDEMVHRFLDAPANQKVVVLGAYRAGSGTIILNSVELTRD
jgi:hypothetical protein